MSKDVPLGRLPSRMGQANLSAAFGQSPDRARGLAGRLTPVAPLPDPVPEPAADPEPSAATTDAAPAEALASAPGAAPATRPAPPVRTTPSGSGRARTSGTSHRTGHSARPHPESGALQVVVVYLPVSVRERLRATAATGQSTFTEIVLSALDATHQQLAQHFAPTTSTTSLFSGRSARRRLRHEEAQVQVSMRLVADDLVVLDQLVTATKAPNRSALVAAALDLHLT
jgi:hypothetical protein